MKSALERILIYLLGGLLGLACAFILKAFHIQTLIDIDTNTVMTVFMSAGILISVSWIAYVQHNAHEKNIKIKDEVVTLITHEMRTSLTACGWIIGSILKKYNGKLDDVDVRMLQGFIDSIHITVMHSVNLLDISLLEIHKLKISLTVEKLSTVEQMFREVLEKYAIGALQKGVSLQQTMNLEGDKLVEVDVLRLRIVLENLLENAIQYSTKKESQIPPPRIEVVIMSKDNTLHISVSDQGIGIPFSEQKKIFSQFYRASNARRTLSTGSGIGLYTSATYIKDHKGTIRFESEEGKGTTFFITVPLKTSADVSAFVKSI